MSSRRHGGVELGHVPSTLTAQRYKLTAQLGLAVDIAMQESGASNNEQSAQTQQLGVDVNGARVA